jgi:hypothetical protein
MSLMYHAWMIGISQLACASIRFGFVMLFTGGLLACGADSASNQSDLQEVGQATSQADSANTTESQDDIQSVADSADATNPPEDVAPELVSDEEIAQPDVAEPIDEIIEEPTGPEESIDCEAIPQGPFQLQKLSGPMASEDLAFDSQGNVIGSNDQAIFKSPYQGQPTLWVPNMQFRAGLRFLPNGHLIVCNNNKGELIRIDEEGVQHVVLSGLSYPNGIVIDMQGWIYFTEHDNNQVRRVHPYTGEWTILTEEISSPNGLAFSRDYRTLYIGGFSGVGTVYAMSISETGTPGKLISWATNVGSGWLDGMAVDACGNVYVADYGATIIYRISPDGQTKTQLITAEGTEGAYLPNMQWGTGIDGWDPLSLYIPDGWNKGVFEIYIGVPGAPVPYP